MSRERRRMLLENGFVLEYILDRGRRQNIYIAVKNGEVILRMPYRVPLELGEDFIAKKLGWVLDSLEKSRERMKEQRFTAGMKLSIAGEEYTIVPVASEKYFQPRFEKGRLEISVKEDSDEEYIHKQAQKAVIKITKELVKESFDRLSPQLGLYPKKITVKKMKASWGRCSSTGNISINSSIVFYDRECIDYVVAHELCHLKYMDHSTAFWGLVSTVCPEWKRIRAKLRY